MGVFLFGKILQAGEEFLRQAGPVPWIQLQGLGFQFIDTHIWIIALPRTG